MKTLAGTILLGLILLNTSISYAGDHILKTKISSDFRDTTELVKSLLEMKGYDVAHEQRCDAGLKKMGYKRGSYSVLFFGKLEQIRELSSKHEALIPFLPFKAAVYADGDGTRVSFLNPQFLRVLVNDDPELNKYIDQWEKDFQSVIEDTQTSTTLANNNV